VDAVPVPGQCSTEFFGDPARVGIAPVFERFVLSSLRVYENIGTCGRNNPRKRPTRGPT
jgi:hypothetical protein